MPPGELLNPVRAGPELMVPAAVTTIELLRADEIVVVSLAALMPTPPALMMSPDEVMTEMLPASLLNAKMP